MKPLYLIIATITFVAMIVLAVALLGNLIDLTKASLTGTLLFIVLMWSSDRIEPSIL